MGTNSCFEDFFCEILYFFSCFPGVHDPRSGPSVWSSFSKCYFGGFPGEYTVLEDLGPKEFGLLCFPGLCRAPNGP